jgi:pSer/pThr/pTyr-binding forkhead associated (FHA) protein
MGRTEFMLPEQTQQEAYLVIQKGSLVGKRVELWKNCTTIGRRRDSDIFLEDIAVHRKQASIIYTSMGYVLRDDHGSGDSFVNGSSVTEQLLNSGDQLLFGNTQMIFYASEGTKPFQLASSRGRELLVRKPPDTSSSTARLQFTNLQASVRSIEVLPDMTIGRSRECDIFLEDLTVSRLHATIKEYGHAEYEIVDNHSATGIFVNGRLIKRHRLQEGDMIQIGNTKFSFRLASHS